MSWRFIGILVLGALCITSGQGFAGYTLSCNEAQSMCQIDTKRIHTRDYVGIFDSKGRLVAIGRVKKIVRQKRQIEILKKYATIARDHEALLISDDEAQDPKRYFKFRRPLQRDQIGMQLGIFNIGVGESLFGYGAQGFFSRYYKAGASFFAMGSLISASGEAARLGDSLEELGISILALGALGGVMWEWPPRADITVRPSAGLGILHASTSAEGGADFKDLVDGRMFPGIGLYARAGLDVQFRLGEYAPYLSAHLEKLQNSQSYSIGLGLLF